MPLTEPAGHPGVSTGFYLVEMAQISRKFGDEYDFTFAALGGHVPQLEINGLSLTMHAGAKYGSARVSATAAQAFRFDVGVFYTRRPELVARRDSELALARRYLGRLPVSEALPNSDKEVVLLRDELIKSMQDLPEHTYPSVEQLVHRHRDSEDKVVWEEGVRLLTSNWPPRQRRACRTPAHPPAARLISLMPTLAEALRGWRWRGGGEDQSAVGERLPIVRNPLPHPWHTSGHPFDPPDHQGLSTLSTGGDRRFVISPSATLKPLTNVRCNSDMTRNR
ncbi:hypothetical protein SGFS_098120 [Streptomyces graminofaciens]|uniref:Uncharacterized protein n=1 Tax=Streptomyces graminofaciens TaxID=68212 RepID=A0ABM7FP04_9ACTN|nr:hypothetical protein [Streptomyces graminofaciens]BBC38518.1 hypothetical protein SGFS_098120 [Streptomyces graminofaciens]